MRHQSEGYRILHISTTYIRICHRSMGPISIINNIEMVQRRAARWVKQEYGLTVV